MDDVRKPSGEGLRVEIDNPQDRCIEQPAGDIRGWFASRDSEIPETFSFQVAGITLPHRIESREDVEGALPGHAVMGFRVQYDVSDYLPYIQNNGLGVRLILSGYDPVVLRFKVEDRALAICLAGAGEV